MSSEATAVHTRLLRFTLGVDEARAWWRARPGLDRKAAFTEYTFGQKSEQRVEVTLANLRARFDAFPAALTALRALDPDPDAARAICHWHVQLSDPLYRDFTAWLADRRTLGVRSVTREEVGAWVERAQPDRWSGATRTMWASKLLSTAREAGLIGSRRDPRPLTVPHVPDRALTYALHLLREVEHAGTLLDNPYLASVGLTGGALDDRLRRLPSVRLHRMGELVDLRFEHADLPTWARSTA